VLTRSKEAEVREAPERVYVDPSGGPDYSDHEGLGLRTGRRARVAQADRATVDNRATNIYRLEGETLKMVYHHKDIPRSMLDVFNQMPAKS
jgi:hypothetical protein